MTDMDMDHTTADVEVLQAETQFVTRRALLLEAKAKEMRSYFLLAQSLSKTSMVKDCYRWNGITDADHPQFNMQPVHDLAGAMMYGAKIGIDPEDAGQMIIMIKGQPSLGAADQVALVRAWCDRRVAQGRTKTFAEGGDWIWEVEADDHHCVWAARRDGDEKTVEWTIARAEQAGYTDDVTTRSGGTMRSKYRTIPTEMLRARTQSEAARLQFKDVLRGLAYSTEELQLEQLVERQVVRPAAVQQGGKGMAALGAAVAAKAGATPQGQENPAPAPQAEPQPQDAVVDGEVVDTVVEPDPPAEPPPTAWDAEADAEGQDAPPPSPPAKAEEVSADPPDEHGLTVLHTMLGEAGFAHRSQKLGIVGQLVGRPLESTKDITNEELGRVNHQLQTWNRDQLVATKCRELLAGGASERATTKELQKLRKAYREHLALTGKDMLEHLSQTLGWNVTDINALSSDDVHEAVAVAEGRATRG